MESSREFPEIVRAALPLATLGLLAHGPAHGYALLERLRALGFAKAQGGTLYPLLKRFEDQGWVTFEWVHEDSGPGKKVFSLTPDGEREREESSRAWARMSQALKLLGDGQDTNGASTDDAEETHGRTTA